MRRYSQLLLLLSACQATPSGPAPLFPDAWVGRWEGEMHVFAAARKPAKVQMALHVARVKGGFQWKIVYGTGRFRDVRDYLLHLVDAARGEYEIDERNAVVRPATYRGGVLITKFAVGDNALLATYRRAGDFVLFETLTGPRASVRTSGGRGAPVVEGYKVLTRQEAVLHRVD